MTQPTLQECLEWLTDTEETFVECTKRGATVLRKDIDIFKAIRAQLEAGAACAEALNKARDEVGDEYEPQWISLADDALTQAKASGLIAKDVEA